MLRERGCVMPFDTKQAQLRDMAQRMGIVLQSSPQNTPLNGTPVIGQSIGEHANNLLESTQASHHASGHGIHKVENHKQSADASPSCVASADDDAVALAAKGICDYVEAQGITHAKPDDEALRKLIVNGATLDDFKPLIGEASVRGHGWGWIVFGVQHRRRASEGNETNEESS